MIPRTIPTWQRLSWQEELSQLVTDPETLFKLLKLDTSFLEQAKNAAKLFPLRSTLSYIQRMEPGNINDPLLRQILPLGAEMQSVEGFVADPLEEQEASPAKGLIHKYKGRVLLIAASQCAINCRYCFRRHFDYSENTPSRQEWDQALGYIRENTSIEEVILSGGDPLAISDKQVEWLINAIADIPQVERLRIHTRLPIVLPSRITDKLLALMTATRLPVVIVVHSNHPQELDESVTNALKSIAATGITLLNQTVLLKDINDDSKTLIALSKGLFSANALPYYLHLLDKVSNTSHFDVKEADAVSLNKALLANLPGYLVPKLVKEVPKIPSKLPIN